MHVCVRLIYKRLMTCNIPLRDSWVNMTMYHRMVLIFYIFDLINAHPLILRHPLTGSPELAGSRASISTATSQGQNLDSAAGTQTQTGRWRRSQETACSFEVAASSCSHCPSRRAAASHDQEAGGAVHRHTAAAAALARTQRLPATRHVGTAVTARHGHTISGMNTHSGRRITYHCETLTVETS